ncbi:MAG: formyltransferase family protein [bacterium]|nr:formyltransferase family protein [bacterium]
MKKDKIRLGVLASGGATTWSAVNSACKSGLIKAETVLFIASKAGIGGIEKARKAGLKEDDIVVIDPDTFSCPDLFGARIIHECGKRGVDIIAQLGWLPKTPRNVIEKYKDRMWNQHPGPLDPGYPDFGGKGMFGRRVHHARLAYCRLIGGDFWTEATAQRVDVEFDKGPVLYRRRIDIYPTDDPTTLQERLLPIEHEVQIDALLDLVNNIGTEKPRAERLVKKEHRFALELAKSQACMMWPKG